jgi:hypothetical protein
MITIVLALLLVLVVLFWVFYAIEKHSRESGRPVDISESIASIILSFFEK